MNDDTRKITTIGVFSALATVLMFIDFPIIPIFPWLKMDFSDIVVLIIVGVYGIKEGLLVVFIKTFIHAIFAGDAGAFYIGDFAALITSCTYAISIYLLVYKYKANKYLSIAFSVILVTLLLTTLNFLIITPIYLEYYLGYDPVIGGSPNLSIKNGIPNFTDFVNFDIMQFFGIDSLSGKYNYFTSICIMYIPFNLLKGTLLMIVYSVIDSKLIPILKSHQESYEE